MRLAIRLVAICGLLACAPNAVDAWFSLERGALLHGEVWRLWTGHVVHFSASHAAGDMLLLFVTAVIAEREMGEGKATMAVLTGAPVISLGLAWLVPEMIDYRGASALSVLLGFIGCAGMWRRAPRVRMALLCLGAAAIAKTYLDFLAIAPAIGRSPDGAYVAWQAHAMACACSAVFMALDSVVGKWERQRPEATTTNSIA